MTEKNGYPNPNDIFPNEFGTTCFLKNVVKAPNIEIGDYTYYDDAAGPQHFEERNVLFNWPQFGDRLVIGKFCAIGSGTQFVMGAANHRLGSASTYPFAVFGGRWALRRCRRTWPSCRAGATPWWATTCGLAACAR